MDNVQCQEHRVCQMQPEASRAGTTPWSEIPGLHGTKLFDNAPPVSCLLLVLLLNFSSTTESYGSNPGYDDWF